MWTRSDLKSRAKALFKRNYWKTVVAALLLTVLAGGGSGAGTSALSGSISSLSSSMTYRSTYRSAAYSPFFGFMFAGMIIVIFLIIALIGIALDILLFNPVEVGIRRFFTQNLYEKAQIREIAFAFDHSYKNIIHVMFFRDLHIFLWSLLFIIPGIVKSYEYRMIPYLLTEYPDMPKDDAFAISKYMMTGNKWKTFVLDLSFILWIIGNAFTCGLLGIFYGNPYIAQTGAALYDALKAEKQPFASQPLSGPQQPGPAPYAPQQDNTAPFAPQQDNTAPFAPQQNDMVPFAPQQDDMAPFAPQQDDTPQQPVPVDTPSGSTPVLDNSQPLDYNEDQQQ